MTINNDLFEEVTSFGDEFKIIVPRSMPELMAREIIEVQPMDIPISKDFLALQEQLEHEIRLTFGYDAHKLGQQKKFPDFFTEEEFNL